ncbi:hypothetical protein [Tahibacter amnicola]|uniref:GHMP kinase N-terminal domain-containing protein n=1 Tax=Tahibacter amnicola TaxID=2976241 RepID=A0ABY6BGT3_9GAMM|nr:hypothetical protein [Tahibacter amnicola]UXI68987.1 hypothetical protein N4264_04860 [Tahibacter amnicola]
MPHPATSAPALAPIISGVCHGTLGELIQGPWDGRDGEGIAIVSLPIRRYSRMWFHSGETGSHAQDLPAKSRCRAVIERYLALHRLALPPGRWRHASTLRVGAGMASSTADIVATIRCLDALFSRRSSPVAIAGLLGDLERSDPVFLDGLALYLSDQQRTVHQFGARPGFHACFIDEGGCVDTQDLSMPLRRHYAAHRPAYARLFGRMLPALHAGAAEVVADCATGSAHLSQSVLPKRHWDALQARRRELRAAGIVVAHTGSLIGYLFTRAPDPQHRAELSAFFRGLGEQAQFTQSTT